MSFFLHKCRYCGAEYYMGMVGMTWLGPTIPCCFGVFAHNYIVPAEDGAPMETVWDRIHRWPGTLCSGTFPG